ncbi:MAG TPA: NAD(P)/FAD-dependent oxidoreductase [Acidimicrobiales bacterium]|nr:NAD(P)/FAD-dependent oxidoreductase [Acidimicrobiales bacterium]
MAVTTDEDTAEHRVVIIGCGFGGLFAARRLARAPLSVTIIDRANHHLFQPLLYQLATGILSPGEIAPAIRDILQRQANTEVLIGNVVDIDPEARQVTSEVMGERTITPYDSLIVATGSGTSYFGHDEFARHAQGIKTIDDAVELRGRIFGAFEMAELEPDEERRRRWLTFVVVGAGATGVEMAGQIAELSQRTLKRNFRRFDPAEARVILLDAGEQILGAFGGHLSERAADELRRLGVEIRLNTMVTGVDETGVEVKEHDGDHHRIDAMVKVWAAGVQASPLGEVLARRAGASLDRSGRVEVQPDCTIAGHPEIFVVGDLMALDDLPGVAEVAMQGGMFAARTIRARTEGRAVPARFRYHDLGTMASVARFHAVASLGPLKFSGLTGWLLWVFVHLLFLTGFKNRVYTVAHWAVTFVGRARSERVITNRQILGSPAIHNDPDELPGPASTT